MTQWFKRNGAEVRGQVFSENVEKGVALYQQEKCCHRCGGQGGSDAWKFTGWTCYECGGSGGRRMVMTKCYTAERLAKLNEAQAKKAEKKLAEKRAKEEKRREAATADRLAWTEANPEVVAYLEAHAQDDEFFESLHHQFYDRGALSEKQADILRNRIERERAQAERVASSAHVGTVGVRQTFHLVVEKKIALHNEREYNPYGPRYVFLCRDQGGQRVVYIGNSDVMHDLPETGGTIAAKVKAHDEYKGERQTTIERPTKVKEAA